MKNPLTINDIHVRGEQEKVHIPFRNNASNSKLMACGQWPCLEVFVNDVDNLDMEVEGHLVAKGYLKDRRNLV